MSPVKYSNVPTLKWIFHFENIKQKIKIKKNVSVYTNIPVKFVQFALQSNYYILVFCIMPCISFVTYFIWF